MTDTEEETQREVARRREWMDMLGHALDLRLKPIAERLQTLEESQTDTRQLFESRGADDRETESTARRAAGLEPAGSTDARTGVPPIRGGLRGTAFAPAATDPSPRMGGGALRGRPEATEWTGTGDPNAAQQAQLIALGMKALKSLGNIPQALEHAQGGSSGGVRKLERAKAAFVEDPAARWEHVAEVAAKAGATSVGHYVEEYTQLRRDRFTVCLATLFAQIGEAACRHDHELTAGLAASGLVFLEQVAIDGNVEMGRNLSLQELPAVVRRTREMPMHKAHGTKGKKAGLASESFATMAEPETVSAVLAAGKNWNTLRETAQTLSEDHDS